MSDMNPPETAGNGPIFDDRPSGGYGEGSAAEIAARARAEAFEEAAKIAETRAARHGQDLMEYQTPGEDSARIQARLSEATTISERIRRRAQS